MFTDIIWYGLRNKNVKKVRRRSLMSAFALNVFKVKLELKFKALLKNAIINVHRVLALF